MHWIQVRVILQILICGGESGMTAAELVVHGCNVYPMADRRLIVVTPYGDAAPRAAGDGWAAVDVSLVDPDGTTRTLCAVLYCCRGDGDVGNIRVIDNTR